MTAPPLVGRSTPVDPNSANELGAELGEGIEVGVGCRRFGVGLWVDVPTASGMADGVGAAVGDSVAFAELLAVESASGVAKTGAAPSPTSTNVAMEKVASRVATGLNFMISL
ncbi:hypothetical protein [Arthrobacter sp. AQ5-05]|uniref:hypothetical protein n=1 Tax=Arthrobacter sp. AQ5-05 TaxID=2184581 RepID=UPI0012B5918D|nr:hypothetical protein [Arthrobacter sp. AQ5-05]